MERSTVLTTPIVEKERILVPHWSPGLVVLSYCISWLGAYTSSQIVIHAKYTRRPATKWLWTFVASVAYGFSAIWSMHFVGVLACQLNVNISFDTALTLFSALVAVFFSFLALSSAYVGEKENDIRFNQLKCAVLRRLRLILARFFGQAHSGDVESGGYVLISENEDPQPSLDSHRQDFSESTPSCWAEEEAQDQRILDDLHQDSGDDLYVSKDLLDAEPKSAPSRDLMDEPCDSSDSDRLDGPAFSSVHDTPQPTFSATSFSRSDSLNSETTTSNSDLATSVWSDSWHAGLSRETRMRIKAQTTDRPVPTFDIMYHFRMHRAAVSPMMFVRTAVWAFAISLMHYSGMWAMQIPEGRIEWDMRIVVLSYVVAFIVCFFACLSMVHMEVNSFRQIMFSTLFAGGISSMHYIGAAGATFYTWAPPDPHPGYPNYVPFIVVGISVIVCVISNIVLANGAIIARNRMAETILTKRRLWRITAEKEAAEQANELKQQFISVASHEIRTPLHAVNGYCELLALTTKLTDEQAMYVKSIQQACHAINVIAGNVLDFSKLERNNVELSARPVLVDLRKMVEDLARIMETKVVHPGQPSVDVIVSVAENVSAAVYLDETYTFRILMNLLSNAQKFCESGFIFVSVTQDPAPSSPDPNSALPATSSEHITIQVRDSGCGIPKSFRAALFQPFRQADTSLTRPRQGTGLGLSIVKHLLQRMNGTVEVDSVEGLGSAFTVRLPVTISASTPTMGPRGNVKGTSDPPSPRVNDGLVNPAFTVPSPVSLMSSSPLSATVPNGNAGAPATSVPAREPPSSLLKQPIRKRVVVVHRHERTSQLFVEIFTQMGCTAVSAPSTLSHMMMAAPAVTGQAHSSSAVALQGMIRSADFVWADVESVLASDILMGLLSAHARAHTFDFPAVHSATDPGFTDSTSESSPLGPNLAANKTSGLVIAAPNPAIPSSARTPLTTENLPALFILHSDTTDLRSIWHTLGMWPTPSSTPPPATNFASHTVTPSYGTFPSSIFASPILPTHNLHIPSPLLQHSSSSLASNMFTPPPSSSSPYPPGVMLLKRPVAMHSLAPMLADPDFPRRHRTQHLNGNAHMTHQDPHMQFQHLHRRSPIGVPSTSSDDATLKRKGRPPSTSAKTQVNASGGNSSGSKHHRSTSHSPSSSRLSNNNLNLNNLSLDSLPPPPPSLPMSFGTAHQSLGRKGAGNHATDGAGGSSERQQAGQPGKVRFALPDRRLAGGGIGIEVVSVGTETPVDERGEVLVGPVTTPSGSNLGDVGGRMNGVPTEFVGASGTTSLGPPSPPMVQEEEYIGLMGETVVPSAHGAVKLKGKDFSQASEGNEEVQKRPVVLLVEDNMVNQHLGRRLLEKLGYGVVAASDGQEAIEKVMQQEFVCCLMDCQMPVLDGFAATSKIRELEANGTIVHHTHPYSPHHRPGRLPIIALTANVSSDNEERCRAAGMDKFLSKPLRLADLLSMIVQYHAPHRP